MKSSHPSSPVRLPDTSASWLVEQIKEGIRARRYAPGQRLIEADLASTHGLRRGPVREALRILAGDGIIELVAQKGARVRQLGTADMRDLVPILSALLRVTIKLSIVGLPASGQLPKLEQTMQAMRSAAGDRDIDQFRRTGLDYTTVLRTVAGNQYLDYIDSKLHADLFYSQAGALMAVDDWPTYLKSYEALHAAIIEGDLATALDIIDQQERTHLY